MRTTLDIDAPVLKELRELQKHEGGTLGALVSRLLFVALAGRGERPTASAFHWTARPMRSLVDLADKEAVHAIPADRSRGAEEP